MKRGQPGPRQYRSALGNPNGRVERNIGDLERSSRDTHLTERRAALGSDFD